FQAEDGIRDWSVTGVQTCALPICENNSFQTRNERIRGRDNVLQLVTVCESGHVGWKAQPRGASLLDTGKDHGCPGPELVAQPQQIGRASCRERGEMSGVEGAVKEE